jgi:hypothetical protein
MYQVNGSNFFPTQRKEVQFIMVRKAGEDHSSPQNYRPISLLIIVVNNVYMRK